MATSTVTLEKAYFETLLRKAQFHTSGVDFTAPVDLSIVTIPKLDHDSLLRSAREYANLRRNLYKGGLSDETLAILISDDTQASDPNDATTNVTTGDATSESGVFQTQRPRSTMYSQLTSASRAGGQHYNYARNDNYDTGHTNHIWNGPTGNKYFANNQTDGTNNWDEDSTSPNNDTRDFNPNRQDRFLKNAKRTVLLTNLPEGTTHADVINEVRGGMLLDIFLRSNDRSCAVSFLEEDNAKDFFLFVKRNDLYIGGKRVDIRWYDRQFVMPGLVASKICTGATRNLVIRNVNPKHTEETIRNDLDHIHNLVIIDVTFQGRDAHITTNSVHNAMFARTCMMSRTTYRGSKIEWDIDECSEPLPEVKKYQQKKAKVSAIKPVMNRFAALDMDGDEANSTDEEPDANGIAFETTKRIPTSHGVAV